MTKTHEAEPQIKKALKIQAELLKRLYPVILVNDKTGNRTQITGYPEDHDGAIQIMRANETNYYRAHRELRLMLEASK